MLGQKLAFKGGLIAECFLAMLVAAGSLYTLYLSIYYGYAVQPFIYNTFDTYMDWFNTAFWSWDPVGAYDNWGTVYAPLSFVIARISTIHSCYASDPIYARDCDWLGRYSIYVSYLATTLVLALVYRHNDRKTWLFRLICMALGLPMLFALERGNFIILATMFISLAFSGFLQSARLKWLFCALAINLKVYLISTLLALLLRRKWTALEQVFIMTVITYVVTWAILGQGTVFQLLSNLFYFSSAAITGTWQDIYFPSSIMSLDRFIENSTLSIKFLGSPLVETLSFLIPVFVRSAQAITILAFAMLLLRPRCAPISRIAAMCIALAVTTSESGGYAHAMVICLVLLEDWVGWARPIALTCCYLISIPAEYVVSYLAFPNSYSWWVQSDVLAQFGIGVGNIARPVLMLVIVYCLAGLTINNGLLILKEERRRHTILS